MLLIYKKEQFYRFVCCFVARLRVNSQTKPSDVGGGTKSLALICSEKWRWHCSVLYVLSSLLECNPMTLKNILNKALHSISNVPAVLSIVLVSQTDIIVQPCYEVYI